MEPANDNGRRQTSAAVAQACLESLTEAVFADLARQGEDAHTAAKTRRKTQAVVEEILDESRKSVAVGGRKSLAGRKSTRQSVRKSLTQPGSGHSPDEGTQQNQQLQHTPAMRRASAIMAEVVSQVSTKPGGPRRGSELDSQIRTVAQTIVTEVLDDASNSTGKSGKVDKAQKCITSLVSCLLPKIETMDPGSREIHANATQECLDSLTDAVFSDLARRGTPDENAVARRKSHQMTTDMLRDAGCGLLVDRRTGETRHRASFVEAEEEPANITRHGLAHMTTTQFKDARTEALADEQAAAQTRLKSPSAPWEPMGQQEPLFKPGHSIAREQRQQPHGSPRDPEGSARDNSYDASAETRRGRLSRAAGSPVAQGQLPRPYHTANQKRAMSAPGGDMPGSGQSSPRDRDRRAQTPSEGLMPKGTKLAFMGGRMLIPLGGRLMAAPHKVQHSGHESRSRSPVARHIPGPSGFADLASAEPGRPAAPMERHFLSPVRPTAVASVRASPQSRVLSASCGPTEFR